MKKRLCFIVLVICTLCGCTHTARLYPVQGPLSAQTSSQFVFVKMTGVVRPAEISVVFSDGEVCKGRWAEVSKDTPAANVSITGDMSSVWDMVYGSGFYVSHVLGAWYYARAVVSGNRGTVLNVEMYTPGDKHEGSSVTSIKGVGRDNKGNIYKLVY